jgi:protein-L-isoaspartate(D-aspartate) O-methyltransferase
MRRERIARREYFSIGEVCEMAGLKPHVLRYWETQFKELSPSKNRAGNRVYRAREIKLIELVKHLLYEEKYTIDGARRRLEKLREEGELDEVAGQALDRQALRRVRDSTSPAQVERNSRRAIQISRDQLARGAAAPSGRAAPRCRDQRSRGAACVRSGAAPPVRARALRGSRIRLPLGHGQTISKPSTHALYLQALNLEGDERVLEIGTGSGYQTALLATLAEHVYSIDRVPKLAEAARARIESLGFTNVAVRASDGTYGWRAYSPFDAVLVTAGALEVPKPLLEQLRPGGRMLIPIGDVESQQLHRIVKTADGAFEDEVIAQVRFVPLRGLVGQDEEERPGGE